jgi:hypothetical protein
MNNHMEAKRIWFDVFNIYADSDEGKTGSMPLNWFSRLSNAKKSELNEDELWADNSWIHWEKLGEDCPLKAFLLLRSIQM